MKKIGLLFFLVPFVLSALNIQSLVGKFISESLSQYLAFLNYGLVLAGTILCLNNKNREKFPSIVKTWFFFYLAYYGLGLLANVVHNNEISLLRTTVPLVYAIGFAFFFSTYENRKIFEKVAVVTFFVSVILLIYLSAINFSYDDNSTLNYELDRAGGVYGDSNNAAIVCILAFVFIQHHIIAKNLITKIFKIAAIGITLYGIILCFSKTGFLVFFVVCALMFHRFFNPSRILLLIFALPLSLYFALQSALNSTHLSLVQKSRVQDIVNILTLNTNKVSYSGRDVLFQNMLNYINANPILGNGVYFYKDISSHNTLFGVWADAGIFCFLLFLFLLFQYFKKSMIAPVTIKFYCLSILTVLFVFMITLQTIISEAYLMVIFMYLAYTVEYFPKYDAEINAGVIA
ncbi:O-antigen ligase family protein [Arenibacter algicola]|uniref:O-antigen ligase family protein n=1 Tax=Arenibacter algicola TaxID=616991 RepID=UPI0004DFBE9F|nr:hypothetical protein [Arenibacter algicola]MBD3661255.1 hypothetical protein [Arenibacter algicola]